MVVTNGEGKCWRGCLDAFRLVPMEDALNKIQWGAFLRSVCIRIGDYAHAGCRLTTTFKKRLTETVATLTMGVVGLRRIANVFAYIWRTLLADVKHVALAERLFQRTTNAGRFDIGTSMLFLTDPSTTFELFMAPGTIFRTPCSEMSFCGHLVSLRAAILHRWGAPSRGGGGG